jgi:hypothetical protein
MLQKLTRILLKAHTQFRTAKSTIPSNVHQLKLRIIRIVLKTHIQLRTPKSTIPSNVQQLKLRITYFHSQIENYYKSLNYKHIKAYFTMNEKKRF